MANHTLRRFAFGWVNAPSRRGRTDQHRARYRAGTLTERAVRWRAIAAAGTLSAVPRTIEICLLDANLGPVGIEFFRDHHGEAGLDALSHVRVFGPQCDGAVRVDAYVTVGTEFGADSGQVVCVEAEKKSTRR